ncbi:unnamed protein product [Durusdinium trenchii]|uniref:Pseudouridine synthase RsuA/RluA-like domain-containing protein n=1 Tax=Durusdinium trenchii TaxID=1381693 RepID=A0ABP0NL98_9DINO
MCAAWPRLVQQRHEDVQARLAQLEFLIRAECLSTSKCLELLRSQPRSLGDYRVKRLWEHPTGLVAVNKPFDMRIDLPKDGGRHWEEELTVADWFTANFPKEKVRFCHQLDHATSGVLLMATNKAAGRVGRPERGFAAL